MLSLKIVTVVERLDVVGHKASTEIDGGEGISPQFKRAYQRLDCLREKKMLVHHPTFPHVSFPKQMKPSASLPTSGSLPIPRKRGMPEETGERVISGLRPKKKPSSSTTDASVVTKRSHSGAAEPFIPRAYQLCHNPLVRLCELLANWRVLHDLAFVRRGSTSTTTVTLAENEGEEVGSMHQKRAASSSSSSNMAELVSIPISFPNYRSYIEIWEPLLITELRANVLSNIPSTTRQGHHGIAYVSSMGSCSVDAKLVSLNCNFVETVATSTNDTTTSR